MTMRSPTNRLIGLFLASITMVGAKAAQTPSATRPDQATLYRWFDSLGYPDITKGEFVEVYYQKFDSYGEIEEVPINYGFLKSASSGRFVLNNLYLGSNGPYVYHSGKVSPTTYKPADLAAYAAEHASYFETLDRDSIYIAFHHRMALADQAFILSRACAARGLNDVANRLYAFFKSMPASKGATKTRFDQTPGGIVSRFGQMDLYGAMLDLLSTKFTRNEVLSKLETFLKEYPEFASYGETEAKLYRFVTASVATLKKMVQEDSAHPLITEKALAKLPQQDQITELIFRLRDQHSNVELPNGVDQISVEADKDSPGQRLAAIGLPALPKLISALNDTDFARTAYLSESDPSSLVLRVSDVAEQIIDKIACRRFRNSIYRDPSETQQKLVADIDAWLQKVNEVGERQVLIEGVEKGNDNSRSMARRLIKDYPNDALIPIEQGVKAAKEDWIAADMVTSLDGLNTPGLVEFMQNQMLHGKGVYTRIAGAKAVNRRDREAAFTALLDIWDQAVRESAQQRMFPIIDSVTAQMLASGRASGLDRIARDFNELGTGDQNSVMFTLYAKSFGYIQPKDIIGGQPSAANTRAFERSLEKFLGGVLIDPKYGEKKGNDRIDGSPDSIPIAQEAAMALSAWFPTKFKFQIHDSSRERSREWEVEANAWRKQIGIKPTPVAPKEAEYTGTDLDVHARTISDITVEGPFWNAGQAFVQAEAMKGTLLSGSAVSDLLNTAAKNWNDGLKDLTITLERDHGGNGVRLTFIANSLGKERPDPQWKVANSISVDGQQIAGSTGTYSKYIPQIAELKGYIDQAARAPSKESIEIRINLSHQG